LIRSGIIKLPDGLHLWIVDVHHIVSDGTSQTILANEFISLYKGNRLEPLKLRYKDFSQWQNYLLESGAIKSQEEYWIELYQDKAGGEIPRLNLVEDYKRPDVFTFAGDHYDFVLEKDVVVKFKALSTQQDVTLYMNILAALNTLFFKYTGQTDIIIGSGIAARPHANLQHIIGMFVNMQTMRNFPGGAKTYQYFLKEVRDNSLKAFENQDIQFEELIDKLDLQRDLSRNPLFDISIVVQNLERVETDTWLIPGQTHENLTPLDYDHKRSKFDMTFLINENREDIHITIEYYTGIFKEETIHRLALHFQNVIQSVISDPFIKLKDIEIMSREEKNQILYTFNDTSRDYPKDKTLHELFAEETRRIPDKIALHGCISAGMHGENGSITYKNLNEKSHHWAGLLIERGVGPDSIVAIMAERSIEMIIGVLGILKAGGAYLPIAPGYPEERKQYMLADSKAKMLITTGSLSGKLSIVNCQLLMVNEELTGSRRLNTPPKEANSVNNYQLTIYNLQLKGTNLAYIIYTSGTTGKPKAAMVEHRSAVRLVKNTTYVELKEGDYLLQTGALEFDASTFEIWGSLLNGLQLYLVSNDVILSAEQLKTTLHTYGITTIWLTSPLFNQLSEQEIEIFKGLRNLLVGGDILSTPHINRLRNQYPTLNIINGYGPTENTTFSTTYLITREFHERIPIGKPIANSFTYIVDKYGYLQPVGIVGELWVGGDGVARGYLNNPELTAEKFDHDLWDYQDYHDGYNRSYRSYKSYILYRTGDLARWLADGNIEFLGRIDTQVKIRGYRIELEEIQSQLLNHEKIQQAVVITGEEENQVKYLCAYVVCKKKLEFSRLNDYLSRYLPGYMIPSYVMTLKEIPLTANGKIDRKKLPPPQITPTAKYSQPRNQVEKKLAEIWLDILSTDASHSSQFNSSPGIDDDFFELGGHSLKATVLAAKIHKEWGVKIPIADIFKKPTIRGLAKIIRETSANTSVSIEPTEERTYYPASSLQKRLYILQQIKGVGTAYHIPYILKVDGLLKKNNLGKAFQYLIRRHESLRTSFEMIGNQVVQRIHPQHHIDFALNYHETSGDEPGEKKVQQIIQDFVKPFDLNQAPLLRVGLIKCSPGKHLLLLDIHHIISDGTSMTILVRDVVSFYKGSLIPSLRIQYKDFALWQNSSKGQAVIKEQETYWLRRFNGEIPQLKMYTDYPRPQIQHFEGDTVHFTLGKDIKTKTRQLNRDTGTTLYMVFLAVFNILLSRYSNQEDIIIGTPIAGREYTDFHNIIGLFINTLPMRNFPMPDKIFLQFLQEVKENTLQAFQNQQYPFGNLLEKLGLMKEISRNPLYDVELAVQNMEATEIRLQHLNFSPYESSISTMSQVDMTFNIMETADTIAGNVIYCQALFKPETMQRMINSFKEILSAVLENRDIQLKDIHIVHDLDRIGSNEYHDKTMEFDF